MILYTKTKVDTPETLEGENLAAHVALCRERDSVGDRRMDDIEARQDKLESREHELRSYILKTITTAAIALLSSAISLGALLSGFVKK
jgi:hypothetical protein